MAVIFTEVKVGDRVWISSGGLRNTNRKSRLETVRRVAPTMITLDHSNRYYRADGSRVGYRGIGGYATCLATPEEIAEWEKQQAVERQKRNEVENARQLLEAKITELGSLFNNLAQVSVSQWEGEGKGFSVAFHGLSEQAVRDLAERIKG